LLVESLDVLFNIDIPLRNDLPKNTI